MSTCVLGRYVVSTVLLVPENFVGGQLRRDKECPFSGVTASGRVWRKVPESDARSVLYSFCCSSIFCSQLAHVTSPTVSRTILEDVLLLGCHCHKGARWYVTGLTCRGVPGLTRRGVTGFNL